MAGEPCALHRRRSPHQPRNRVIILVCAASSALPRWYSQNHQNSGNSAVMLRNSCDQLDVCFLEPCPRKCTTVQSCTIQATFSTTAITTINGVTEHNLRGAQSRSFAREFSLPWTSRSQPWLHRLPATNTLKE
ncbi:hypothetical protein ASPSYDRAFT_1122444 [Aspergillus sydowii CBS 593.65]|uniref:Uncharacterized protein n=1 Tax=Aspergillus sydowii CBS 593.65 TaxID=1036612 RepID=A0A1L9TCV4_9EURO|nr:uncharacterized protein ASPSYDRAFT_1122444 [Aspergillus sydowii CBS 593.65]OJJ57113.1 hypothetical protein ASPSYDRAFT_1122444 [Aspergillus sydowii CBS 593.65]